MVLGARVGINNHVTIGEGAQLAAASLVHGNVPAGSRWGGIPAKPVKEWFREITWVTQEAKRGRTVSDAEDAGAADDRGRE